MLHPPFCSNTEESETFAEKVEQQDQFLHQQQVNGAE